MAARSGQHPEPARQHLDAGRHGTLTGELDALAESHPHRERLQAQRMLALYRAGRQADALAAYRDARDALDELGLERSAAVVADGLEGRHRRPYQVRK